MENPILKNIETGHIIELIKSPFTIGRGLNCDYIIENKIISRTHCTLINSTSGWSLRDSSTNGTLVNEGHYRGETSPLLKHNDEISLGYQSYTYKFLTECDKVPHCQVENLKKSESNVQPTTSSDNQSNSFPGTPNSFDENGVSDELLNNLADNILSCVETQPERAENVITEPSMNLENSQENNKPPATENHQPPETSRQSLQFSDINSDPQNSVSASPNNTPTQNQANNVLETPVESQPASSNTVISTLPENNRAVVTNQNPQNISNASLNQQEIVSGIADAKVVADPKCKNTSITIDSIVQKYTDGVISTITSSASTIQQTNVVTRSQMPPSTISLSSSMNSNKKVKIMTVGSGVLKPVPVQIISAFKLNAGQQAPVVRMVTRNELQRIMQILPSSVAGSSFSGSSVNPTITVLQNVPTSLIKSSANMTPATTTLPGTSSERPVNVETVDSTPVSVDTRKAIESPSVSADDLKIESKNVVAGEPSTSKNSQKTESKQDNANRFEEMENELLCAICSNLFIKTITLGCSHSFCQYCIEQWKKKKTECPICRTKISSTIRTLVLDNIIEKMLENSSEQDKLERKAAIEERNKVEAAKSNKKNARGANTARRGRTRGNSEVNHSSSANPVQTNIQATANPIPAPPAPPPIITIPDSPLASDSNTDEDVDDYDYDYDVDDYDYDDYYADGWYNGNPGAYYGGYGRCYNCGDPGHWSNGCPYR